MAWQKAEICRCYCKTGNSLAIKLCRLTEKILVFLLLNTSGCHAWDLGLIWNRFPKLSVYNKQEQRSESELKHCDSELYHLRLSFSYVSKKIPDRCINRLLEILVLVDELMALFSRRRGAANVVWSVLQPGNQNPRNVKINIKIKKIDFLSWKCLYYWDN